MDPQRYWRIASRVLLILLTGVMYATVLDYGLAWDEYLQRLYGDAVLSWFTSGGQDRTAIESGNLFLYGGLFDAVAQLWSRLSPLGVFEDRHLLTVACGLATFAGARGLGIRFGGERAGFLALLFAVLTPMLYGHAFNNPKDIPFAACFVWVLCLLVDTVRVLPALRVRELLPLGLVTGLLLAARPGGIFTWGYIATAWSVAAWTSRREPGWDRRRLALAFAAVCVLSWIVMIACWPFGLESPLLNPLRAIRDASRFGWYATTLFLGRAIPARHPPLTYLPVWFGMQLPEFYFLGWALALAVWFRERRTAPPGTFYGPAFLVSAIAFPVVAAIVLRSTLYDALRHVLFLIAPMAALAAWGVDTFLREKVPAFLRGGVALALGLACGSVALDMVALHPYEAVYFNRLVAGGLRGASGRMETDYWGLSYREALDWVVKNVPGPVRVGNCSIPILSAYYLPQEARGRLTHVADPNRAHILLATTRWNCHKRKGRVLHLVERQGVALTYVLDMRTPP